MACNKATPRVSLDSQLIAEPDGLNELNFSKLKVSYASMDFQLEANQTLLNCFQSSDKSLFESVNESLDFQLYD